MNVICYYCILIQVSVVCVAKQREKPLHQSKRISSNNENDIGHTLQSRSCLVQTSQQIS